MPMGEGFQEPKVGEFRIPKGEMVGDEVGELHIPEAGVDEHPRQLPGQTMPHTQEFSAGAGHWLAILGVLVGVWWLFSRSSSGGKSTGGSSRLSRNAAGRPGPDAEELRRKRLEALGTASRATPEATNKGTREQAGADSNGNSNLRKRTAAAAADDEATRNSSPKAENQPQEAVEKAATAVQEENAAEPSPSPSLTPVLQPQEPAVESQRNPPVEERTVESEQAPSVEERAVEAEQAPVAEASHATATAEVSSAPAAQAASDLHGVPAPTSAESSVGEPQAAESASAVQSSSSKDAPPEEDAVIGEANSGSSQATPAEPEDFKVCVQGNLAGRSLSRTLQKLRASMTVSELKDLVASAFEISPSQGIRVRLFFKQKELKSADVHLAEVGISAGSNLQAIFEKGRAPAATAVESQAASSPTAATAAAPSAAAPQASDGTASEDNSPPFSVRAQGMLNGSPSSHVIEALRGSMAVRDLEGLIAAAFSTGNSTRLRLFYMGRELKDGDATLGGCAMKADSTVQVMFAPGAPRHKVPDPEPAAATGSSDTADATTTESSAVAAATPSVAAAGDTQTGTVQDTAAPAPPSPAEAWQALAMLEQQLSRASDESEAPAVRQAAMMLKQMLTTLTHENNPALLQTAQVMVPDLKQIWAFNPTREHLCYLLNPAGFAQDAAFASSSSADPAPGSSSA